MSQLTVDTFKLDYSRLVMRHGGNKEKMKQAAQAHIDAHYSHIKRQCQKWLDQRNL